MVKVTFASRYRGSREVQSHWVAFDYAPDREYEIDDDALEFFERDAPGIVTVVKEKKPRKRAKKSD